MRRLLVAAWGLAVLTAVTGSLLQRQQEGAVDLFVSRELRRGDRSRPIHHPPALRSAPGFSVDDGVWTTHVGPFVAKVTETGLAIGASGSDANTASVQPGSRQPVSFTTVSVGRTGAPLPLRGPPALDRAGDVVREHGAVAEVVHPSREGVELSWRFASRPAGSGALLVRVATHGLLAMPSDAYGARLADARGQGFRFSHGTWVDARGRRSPVPVIVAGEDLVLSVPTELIDSAAYPAVLDPTISAEAEFEPPQFGSLPDTTQYSPVVASRAPGQHLLVWTETRYVGTVLRYRRFARRVGADGTPIDVEKITFGEGGASSFKTAVASDGSNYLVVWSVSGAGVSQIVGRRVSADGRLIDAADLVIASTTAAYGVPELSIAWDGSAYVVAWESDTDDVTARVFATRVSAAGAPLRAEPVELSAPSVNARAPRCAVNAGQVLVTWYGADGVRATRLSPTGERLDGPPLVLTGLATVYQPTAAPLGDGFVVVWETYGDAPGHASNVFGARLSRTGAFLDTAPFPIARTADYEHAPVVTADAAGARAIWLSGIPADSGGYDRLQSVRISTTGSLGTLTTEDPRQRGATGSPAMTFDGVGQLAVWSERAEFTIRNERVDYSVNCAVVYGARFGAAGEALDPSGRPLGTAAAAQVRPVLAWNGTNHLAVWEEERGGSWNIRGARLRDDGTVRDVPSLALGAPPQWAGRFPAVAALGADYLVAYLRYDTPATGGGFRASLVTLRVDGEGRFAEPVVVAADRGSYPALAASRTQYLLAWVQLEGVWGLRLDASGRAIAPGPFLIQPRGVGENMYRTRVASDGSAFLVVWKHSDAFASPIVGVRVDATGRVLDAMPRSLMDADWDQPALTFGGGEYLLAATGRSGVGAARIATSGVPGPTVPLVPNRRALSWSRGASVAWDGARYLVTFGWPPAEPATGESYPTPMFGLRLRADGSALDPAPFPIGNSPVASHPSGLVAVRPGRFTLAYARPDEAPAAGNFRAKVRTLDFPAPMACSTTVDCRGGPCVDGFCCDGPCGGGDPSDCQACSVAAGSPVDGLCAPVPVGRSCRAAAGPCDRAEVCDGAGRLCPSDALAVDGTECGSRTACASASVCRAGVCNPGTAVTCRTTNPCEVASCVASRGCVSTPVPGCTLDAGLSDAAVLVDGSRPTDATPTSDLGVDGAVATDRGLRDVSSLADRSVDVGEGEDVDVSSDPDAGDDAGVPIGPGETSEGCGCSTQGSSRDAPMGILALVGLIAVRRRRRLSTSPSPDTVG